MSLTLIIFGLVVAGALVAFWITRTRTRDELEQHGISAEALHSLLASKQDVLVFDVRQPLDLLAYPEIIPSAQRIPPDDVLAKPSLIPKEKDVVVYCTCPSDKTSREVLRRTLDRQYTRIKFLRGGLEAWKMKGFAVEPYKEVFHLHKSAGLS